jgi:ring-1,2-phenylacetyl-CoA epoxidase subunit PaaD
MAVGWEAGCEAIWGLLSSIQDPEIPVLSIVDLGIVRGVELDGKRVRVRITPTYSGCPATDLIHSLVLQALGDAGYRGAEVVTELSPAWTTDWLSAEGRQKLQAYGIAPPAFASTDKRALTGQASALRCPRCDSPETERLSEFGSTPCKAHYRCLSCLEPFDYFKCH